MSEQTNGARKPKRARSPSYPGIGLRDALERARTLYSHERRNPAPVNAILEHWGYQPNSGAGLVVVAALKKFGLIVDEGSGKNRRARLSDLAIRILLDEREDSSERLKFLQDAALKPLIHRDLWDEYDGSLPSDQTLKHRLIFDKNFTERAVREFIPEFRDTLAFADLVGSDSVTENGGDKGREGQEGNVLPPAPPPDAHAIQLPIATGEWATLQAAFPLTGRKWKQMLAVLEAMKPALVESEEQKRDSAPDAD